ncbi:MAG: biotin--[acetyl-CoA-carboxylase] ligase [Firmicutes bacterium]|nr:biotin--[acetyl-CoA-carboxylase] ligase [Bacillota bacterium]
MRDTILRLLKTHEEISGQAISDRLQISRSAVAKHIAALRSYGYVIEATPGKGYRLLSSGDTVHPAEIRALLPAGQPWQIRYEPEVLSTNVTLRQMAEQGAADHTVLLADRQTAGQGRLSRVWYCQPQTAVILSLLLRPPIDPYLAGTITLLTAVAVCDALRSLGVEAYIKWPNDVLSAGGKKLCGIKCEMRCSMDICHWLIAGFGINVRNRQFPQPLQDIAGSLYTETGRDFPRANLAAACLDRLEAHYQTLLHQGFEPLRRLWLQYAVSIGKPVTAALPDGRRLRGLALDIDANGSLLLQTEQGVQTIHCGDIFPEAAADHSRR